MKLTNSVLCVAVVTTTFVACGGGGSPSDALRDGLVTICEQAHECRDSYDPAMNDGIPFEQAWDSSSDDCIAKREAILTLTDGTDKLDASVDAGRIEYSAVNAKACLDAIGAQTCDQLFDQNGQRFDEPQVCDAVFVGTVPTGGACTFDGDCATEGDDCLSTNVCG